MAKGGKSFGSSPSPVKSTSSGIAQLEIPSNRFRLKRTKEAITVENPFGVLENLPDEDQLSLESKAKHRELGHALMASQECALHHTQHLSHTANRPDKEEGKHKAYGLMRTASRESLPGELCKSTRPTVAGHLALERRRKRDIAWPYVQKGITSGIVYMLGEAISCGLFSRDGQMGIYPDAFIRYSVLHSMMIGMLANGPMLHLFFEMVDRYVKFKSQVLNVLMKVLVDQVVWGCLWNFSYILLMNIATDSPGFGYIGEGLGMDFVIDLYKGVNSAFWKAIDWRLHVLLLTEGLKMLPCDVICYWLVPLRLRTLWVVSVDVFWVTILSQYD